MYKIRGVLLVIGVLGLALLSLALQPSKTRMAPMTSVATQQTVSLAPFTSVQLDSGVKAVLEYGPVQRVTLLKGSADVSVITVTQDRLVIDKCRDKCPRGYELHVEIVIPFITGISVAHGGAIESRGNFPRHTAMSLAVSHDGTVSCPCHFV